jgi:hypothetical protein
MPFQRTGRVTGVSRLRLYVRSHIFSSQIIFFVKQLNLCGYEPCVLPCLQASLDPCASDSLAGRNIHASRRRCLITSLFLVPCFVASEECFHVSHFFWHVKRQLMCLVRLPSLLRAALSRNARKINKRVLIRVARSNASVTRMNVAVSATLSMRPFVSPCLVDGDDPGVGCIVYHRQRRIAREAKCGLLPFIINSCTTAHVRPPDAANTKTAEGIGHGHSCDCNRKRQAPGRESLVPRTRATVARRSPCSGTIIVVPWRSAERTSERDKTAALLVVRRDATEHLCRPSPSAVPPCLGGHCWWRCRLSSGRVDIFPCSG